MNIAIVLGPFSSAPPNGYGAVETRWKAMAEEFHKRGISVEFFQKASGNIDERNELVKSNFIKGFSRTGSILFDILLDSIYSVRALLLLARRRNDFDLIIINVFWLPLFLSFFKAAFKSKIVVNVARQPKIHVWLYCFVDLIIVPSNVIARNLAEICPVIKRKLFVVNNPLSNEFLDCSIIRNSILAGSRIVKIVYAGRIHREKGLEILVDACRQLASANIPISLHFIGPIAVAEGGSGDVYFHDLLKRWPGGSLRYHGVIAGKMQLRDELLTADLFVYPSVATAGESFGMAPLEAMAVGCPTVLSDLECFSEFAKNGTNCVQFSLQASSPSRVLADILLKLISDDNYRYKISLAGIHTGTEFSAAEIAGVFLKLVNTSLPINRRANCAVVLGPFMGLPGPDIGAVERRWWDLLVYLSTTQDNLSVDLFSKKNTYSMNHNADCGPGLRLFSFAGFSRSRWLFINLIKDFAYTLLLLPRVIGYNYLVTNSTFLPFFCQMFCQNVIIHVARFPKANYKYYPLVKYYDVVSTAVGKQLLDKLGRFRSNRTVVFCSGNPVDLDTFSPATNKMLNVFRPEILYVGRVAQEKGLDSLIEAFRRVFYKVPSAVLKVVGPYSVDEGGGGVELFDELKQQANGLPVEFVGPIRDKERLRDYFRAADVFVYPSVARLGESFGLAPLEAMACGTPVVVSDLDCFVDFVIDRKNGFICKSNDKIAFENSLADAICKIIESPDRYSDFRAEAINSASRFSVPLIAERIKSANFFKSALFSSN